MQNGSPTTPTTRSQDSFAGIPRWGIARLNGDGNVIRLGASDAHADQSFEIRLLTRETGSYRMQTSTDLRAWTDLATVTKVTTRAPSQYPVTGEHQQFYRAVLVP